MTASDQVGLLQIKAARTAIAAAIRETPVVASPDLSTLCGVPVHLKLEHQQVTGSFKLRGATNAVSRLSPEQRAKGVVGVSAGNHGRGLAYAAREAGVRCIICMSQLVPANKVEGIKAQGADVLIIGRSQDEAQHEVNRLVTDEGMTMLPPFDHPDIIAGQGTVGLEILDQLPDVGTVLVQVSGGGLISGVAAGLKAQRPRIRVIGISMERGAAMYASLADSLGGGIGLDNRYTFRMAHDLVDEFVLVSEAEIAAAVRHAYWNERQIIEGPGSVGIAALLSGKVRPTGITLALLSGGNIDMDLHYRLISGEVVDVS